MVTFNVIEDPLKEVPVITYAANFPLVALIKDYLNLSYVIDAEFVICLSLASDLRKKINSINPPVLKVIIFIAVHYFSGPSQKYHIWNVIHCAALLS